MPIRSPAEAAADRPPPALEGATATLLLTLAARAAAPALRDAEAQAVAAALPGLPACEAAFVEGVALRTALFDRFAARFFDTHPDGFAVTLGAGLCTRRSRLGLRGSPHRTDWLCIDLPEAIRLREAHLPPAAGERRLAGSVLDPAWLDVAASLREGRPMLLMLEGVCPYLPQAPLEAMLREMAARFASPATACTLVLDWVHPSLARMPTEVGGMHLPVVSGFEDAAQVAALHPALRVLSEDHLYALFSPQHARFDAAFRAATGRAPYGVGRLALGGA